MKLKAVYIQWQDVIGDPDKGWKDKEDTDTFFNRTDNLVDEIGFIWKEDKDYLCLCGGYMDGEIPLTRHRTKIPRSWVTKRINIELEKKSNKRRFNRLLKSTKTKQK